MADPCIHERDWLRIERDIERHDAEIKSVNTTSAETKVYIKQVLESQSEIKETLKEVITKLNAPFITAHQDQPPTPISQDTQMSLLHRMFPQLLDLLKWAIIIIGALVGVGSLMK